VVRKAFWISTLNKEFALEMELSDLLTAAEQLSTHQKAFSKLK